jgi:hypothetical protein
MRAIDRLRQELASGASGSFGSTPHQEYEDSHARVRAPGEGEVDLSVYLKKKETPCDDPSETSLSERRGTAETADIVPDARTASRGPCTCCGQPVHWHDGLRNWFGDPVHLTCPPAVEAPATPYPDQRDSMAPPPDGPMQRAMAREMTKPRPASTITYAPVHIEQGGVEVWQAGPVPARGETEL